MDAKACKKSEIWDGNTATCKKIRKGMKVKLRDNVLQRHSRSVPAHLGYTKEQFGWRDTLRKCKEKVGTIERTFPDSRHVNVQFGKTLIGIENTELEKI